MPLATQQRVVRPGPPTDLDDIANRSTRRRNPGTAPPEGRSRRPLLALAGVLIVMICTLLGVVIAARIVHRSGYVAVARNLPQGAVISPADLTVINLATTAGLDAIGEADAPGVVGKRATEALAGGSLLTPTDVSVAAPMPATDALVGTSVAPNQAPAGLQVGMPVLIVLSGAAAEPAGAASPGPAADPGSSNEVPAGSATAAAGGSTSNDILGAGVVYAVSLESAADAPSSGGELVTLEIPRPTVAAVAAASAAGDVSLAEIAGS